MAAKPSDAAKPETLGWPREVAEMLGVPEHTLDIWRSQGKGPDYHKVGRYVRYRWADVNAWLATRKVRNTGAA
jgi:predicted DNA-binding transcriptional regulator AlpA